MKLILTGSSVPATQFSAYIPGLHVLPAAEVLPAAKQCAKDIAGKSRPVIALAKQAILAGTCLPSLSQAQRERMASADKRNSRKWT